MDAGVAGPVSHCPVKHIADSIHNDNRYFLQVPLRNDARNRENNSYIQGEEKVDELGP